MKSIYQRVIYQSKIKLLEENVEKLKTKNKRLVEEVANYFKIIKDLSKGHTSTQNNEHHDQLQTGDLQWSINNIHLKTFRGATCKDMTEQNLMELLFTWVLMMCQQKGKDPLMLLIQLYQLVKSVKTQV